MVFNYKKALQKVHADVKELKAEVIEWRETNQNKYDNFKRAELQYFNNMEALAKTLYKNIDAELKKEENVSEDTYQQFYVTFEELREMFTRFKKKHTSWLNLVF